MPAEVDSKVVVVTGASSGIGLATAHLLADRGHKVTLCARRVDRIEAARDQIIARGGEALAVACDVSSQEDCEAVARDTLARWGQIDVLVNNAGVMLLSPLDRLRTDDWVRMFRVNVEGALFMFAAVLPNMLERESGHIVNVGSVAGRRPFPSGSVYAATKFAVRAISAGIHLELSASRGVRVTDIEPGVVRTELADHIPDPEAREGFAARWADARPLESEDIAESIRYAVEAPAHVNVNEILIRPTDQAT